MVEMQINVKGKLQQEDVTKYTYAMNFKTIVFLILFLLVIASSKVQTSSIEHSALFFGILVACLIYGSFFGLKILAKRNYRTNKLLQSEFEYLLSNNGMNITTEDGQAFLPWNKVYKVRISKDFFAMYISNSQAYLIPKRCFSNANDIESLKDILQSNLPKDKFKINSFRTIFNFARNVSFYLLLIIIVVSVIDYYSSSTANKWEKVSYTQFLRQVEEQKVERVKFVNNNIYGKLKNGQNITTFVPNPSSIIGTLREKKVDITFEESPPPPWWTNLLSK